MLYNIFLHRYLFLDNLAGIKLFFLNKLKTSRKQSQIQWKVKLLNYHRLHRFKQVLRRNTRLSPSSMGPCILIDVFGYITRCFLANTKLYFILIDIVPILIMCAVNLEIHVVVPIFGKISSRILKLLSHC